MDQYLEIRDLSRQGMSQSEIARRTGLDILGIATRSERAWLTTTRVALNYGTQSKSVVRANA